ncbi:MAG: thioredoxin family protein [Fibrobacterales bacterium]
MAHTTEKTFKKHVLKSKKPVLVHFWSVWDDLSKASKPVIEQVAKSLKNKADVFFLNSDENAKITRKYNIDTFPTAVIFKDGEIVSQFRGLQPEPVYINAIENY